MKVVLIPPGEFEMGSTPDDIAADQQRTKIWNAALPAEDRAIALRLPSRSTWVCIT